MTIFTMFPIIPQHRLSLPRPQESRSARVLVVTAQGVPAFASTPPIPLEDVVGSKLDRNKYELVINKTGELTCQGGGWSWVRHARVSPDCHSYNTLIHRVQHQPISPSTVVNKVHLSPNATTFISLQTVRELRPGEELCIWFNEDISATIGIPFLTPINIQGEKNYICHRCRKYFEYPNPLKIHLALDCGTMRRVELWKRLFKSEESILACDQFKICDLKLRRSLFNFKNFSKSLTEGPISPINSNLSTSSDPSTTSVSKSEVEPERPSSEPVVERPSAFKPYLTFKTPKVELPGYKSSNKLVQVPSNLIFSQSSYSSQSISKKEMPSFSTLSLSRRDEGPNIMEQQAVEMETLVSNLGRSKQGHLCIYCGKVYSRKYGLKIHIRTHTGFKPLKCKYCLRPFGDPSNLNKHVRLHAEGDTPYKCEECGKVLVRRRDLERHIKSRHQPEDST